MRQSFCGFPGGLLLALLILPGLPPMVGAQTQVEGEYALWVTDRDGELGVGWLTPGAQEGFLQVLSDGRVVFEVETPSGGAHFASLPRPSTRVVLRYGTPGPDEIHSTTLYLDESRPPDSGVLSGVDSLFVVGDVHGEYERLLELLQNARLIGSEGDWVGGTRHVVFLGDIFDRGADVTKTLWFLYRLEREARAAGGGAHVVLGNHETMIFTHDVRYVSAKEQLIARLHGTDYGELFDPRYSVLGKWLAQRPGAMQIDEALLAHGGILPEVGPQSVEVLNDSVRAFIAEELFYRWADSTVAIAPDRETAELVRSRYSDVLVVDAEAFQRRMHLLFDERSILWFRGYVRDETIASELGYYGSQLRAVGYGTEETFADELDQTLETYEAELHVVGHTPVPSIESRYSGKLLAVDLLEPATEMLLLVRDPEGDGYQRWRYGLEGPPQPL